MTSVGNENCRDYKLVVLAVSPVFSKNVSVLSDKTSSINHFWGVYISFLLNRIECQS